MTTKEIYENDLKFIDNKFKQATRAGKYSVTILENEYQSDPKYIISHYHSLYMGATLNPDNSLYIELNDFYD